MALQQALMPTETQSQSFYLSTSSPSSPKPVKRMSRESQRSSGVQNKQISSTEDANDNLAVPLASPYPQSTDPSPVDSNGTTSTTTTIEDDESIADNENEELESDLEFDPSPFRDSASPSSPSATLGRIDTSLAAHARSDSVEPLSVIHAPQHFSSFSSRRSPPLRPASSSQNDRRQPSASSESTSRPVVSPLTPQDDVRGGRGASPQLKTDIPASTSEKVMATPQAHTREELEAEWSHNRRRSGSLTRIPEADNIEGSETDDGSEHVSITSESTMPEAKHESIKALKDRLGQAWGLCTSLSTLSSNHRNRVLNYSGKDREASAAAWQSCWKLCQHLYDSREDTNDSEVEVTLELCRDFCDKLFTTRKINSAGAKESEYVLRVSFELNKHLYNGLDTRRKSLDFQERTLEFYWTLCHRIMSQERSLPGETDNLLRACWNVITVLFQLRERRLQGKPDVTDEDVNDEDLLTAAIHACWELTDRFKEGWNQTIPTRTTPRASQEPFSQSQSAASGTQYTYNGRSSPSAAARSSTRSSSAMSRGSIASSSRAFIKKETFQAPPETPTTVFDDTNDHIESFDDNHPNILVLGPENPRAASQSSLHRSSNPQHWSSAASAFSESSQRTSSTATATSKSVNHMSRVRVFLAYVAKEKGFVMAPIGSSSSPKSIAQHAANRNNALNLFIRSMSPDAFGSTPDQRAMLERYQEMCLTHYPLLGTKYGKGPQLAIEKEVSVTLAELGRAVLWVAKHTGLSGPYGVKELFRMMFRCSPDHAQKDRHTSITA